MATIRKLRDKWQGMVRRKGHPQRCKSFEKKSDAERWARELESQVDRSAFLPDTRLAEQTSIGDLLERYMREITPHKRSADSEIYRIKAIIRRPIAKYSLAALTSSHMATYRDERLKIVAPATITRELNTISHAIDTARREWGIYVHENPLKLVKRPTLPKGRIRRLENGEQDALLAASDVMSTPYLKDLIIIALETAMRRGELLSLLWDNVDFDKKTAHLTMTKNGESRDVPLSPKSIEVLKKLHQSAKHKFVFPVSDNAVRLAWERLRAKAGCPDLNFHDLRHEAVSRLFEKGLDMMSVASISGHKELRMLQRYTHLRAEDLANRL